MKEYNKYKILFISHDASRTGAPYALLHIIAELKRVLGINTDIILKEDGPLKEKFELLGNVYVYSNNSNSSKFSRVLNLIFKLKQKKEQKFFKKITSNGYDLIYANTAASSDILLKILKKTNTKSVLHIHELKIMIKRFCGEKNFIEAASLVDKIFAVSSLVENMLLNEYSISSNRFIKVYEPVSEYVEQNTAIRSIETTNQFTVVGSGTLDWRKGTDLFITIAKQLNLNYPNNDIRFLWVGGNLDSQEYDIMQNDIDMAGLTEKIGFTGSVQNPREYFKNSNMLLLTSREDPFPLVVLENAYEGNPIICFKQATGVSDFINSTNGLSSDFLDLTVIVNEIHKLSTDEIYYTGKSKNIKELSSQFSPELVCKPIIEVLTTLLDQE